MERPTEVGLGVVAIVIGAGIVVAALLFGGDQWQ